MSKEMKELVLLLANAVTEMLDHKADKMETSDNLSTEIKRLTAIIRERGG